MPVSLTDPAILFALLAAALLGGVLSAIWLRSRTALAIERAQAERSAELLTAQERLRAASLDIDRLRAELKVSGADRATLDLQLQQEKAARVRAETQAQRLPALEQALADARLAHDRALAEGAAQRQSLAEAVAGLRTQLDAERSQTTEKLALLDAARDQMGLQFQEVANRILEEKSQRFTQQNHDNLGLLLNPLNEKIKAFQEQVAQTYDRESKERLTLKNEIERLALLNARISEDAVNLTQALKGSNKSQGIWGEMVLEKVLESSGLRRGHEYVAEESYAADDGNRRRPDVVIQLPEGRHMIVDAKMSLLGYERYCSADNDAARAAAQREHVQSIRAHIKGLSDKNYPMLNGLKAPDFVLMFVPVEPAFMLAATSDTTLFEDAFARNVLLVSPSTLLAVLRMVANVWRQESQGRNAQQIAEQGARMYDKFVGFIEDLEEIGKRIDQTQKAYQDAHGKLSTGRGNLVRQVDNLRRLGVKPARQLRVGLLPDEQAIEGSSPDPELPD